MGYVTLGAITRTTIVVPSHPDQETLIHLKDRMPVDIKYSYPIFNWIAVTWLIVPDSKVYGAYMGPTWGRQDPGGPHVGPMNLVIWVGCPVCSSSTGLSFVRKT